MLYHWFLLLDRFRFCETHFTIYQRFVADQSALSPFLGGLQKSAIILRSLLIRWIWFTHDMTHSCKYIYSQSHLGWHFRKALSKLKAQSSKLERLFSPKRGKRGVRALSFELWNSIRKCHPKWDRLYIIYIYMWVCVYLHAYSYEYRKVFEMSCTNIYIYVYTYICVCICIHIYVCVYLHVNSYEDRMAFEMSCTNMKPVYTAPLWPINLN